MGKKRNFFMQNKNNEKRRKYNEAMGKLDVGVRGIMITHDRGKEARCRSDAFRLFNQLADEWYGKYQANEETSTETNKDLEIKHDVDNVEKAAQAEKTSEDSTDESDADIDAALSKEVDEMKKSVSAKHRHLQRFSALKSGCNNVVFIKCVGITPSEFVQRIIKHIDLDNGSLPVPYNLLRVHPADVSCKAYIPDIREEAEKYLPKAFADLCEDDNEDNSIKHFNIVYRGRNSEHMHMHDVQNAISLAAQNACPAWHYNCRSNEVHVVIDVIKTVCTMAVVKGYAKFKKFNVRELFLEKQSSSNSNKDVKEGTNFTESNNEKESVTANGSTGVKGADDEKPNDKF